ncbi:MAG: DEAD/DEAH box helicase [Nitrospirae bacterium]|nr:DEAD/DEAH box helicase [Nitrospirota bacterium]
MAAVTEHSSSPAAPSAPRAPEDPSGIRTTTSTTFHSLPIAPQVLEGLDRLGYTHCTPIQEQTLPITLAGKDVAGQAQTGTGKTAAFLVSLFTRLLHNPPPPKTPRASPRALVIAPTRELVVQIEQEARAIGVTTGLTMMAVYGGIDYIKQRDLLAAGVDVLVGTPGRLIDYFKQKIYDLRRTEVLVVDEADRMFDMGFIADIRYLLRRLPPYDKRQSMLFSATLSARVMELCYEHMNNPVKVSVSPRQITAEKVQEVLFHVEKAKKTSLLLGLLKREPWERVLIFVNTKHVGERLTDVLNHQGYTARALTGDIPQNKRLKYLERFKSGELKILVATDVASRGLHIEGVSIVVNFDLPQDREDYVHRIGRTARAGATGKAISLACEEYVMTLDDIEAFTGHKVPVEWAEDELFLPVAHTPRRARRPLPGATPSSGAKAPGSRGSDPGKRGPSRPPGRRATSAGKGSSGSGRRP